MTAKKTAPAKAPAEKAQAQEKKTPKVKGFIVGETGIKIGRTVYAPGAEVPSELVTDEIAPFLVEGVVDATAKEITDSLPQGGDAVITDPQTGGDAQSGDPQSEKTPEAGADAQGATALQGGDAQTGGTL